MDNHFDFSYSIDKYQKNTIFQIQLTNTKKQCFLALSFFYVFFIVEILFRRYHNRGNINNMVNEEKIITTQRKD